MPFSDVPPGPLDPMFVLKRASDGDTSPSKIDVGIGVYRGEKSGYHEFEAVTKAKKTLDAQNPGHEYNSTTGIASFLTGATQLVFGKDNPLVLNQQIASVQTVGGTGAVHLAAAFLNRNFPAHSPTPRHPNPTQVYVGTPTWPNYHPLFQHSGFRIRTFQHFDQATNSIDMPAVLDAISTAPNHSIFILQVCCHNPTGQDYNQEQWLQLGTAIKPKNHFIFFDIAYQGLATDLETDAFPIRHFASQGIGLLAAQSFSKHMGLYSERIGALHIPCSTPQIAINVQDQLRSLTRWEVSSTPAYGAHLASIIMHDPALCDLWRSEVEEASRRIVEIRRQLFDLLTENFKNKGSTSWSYDHVLREKGLFSYFSLKPEQIQRLRDEFHIYVAGSGRVNVAGLNKGNVARFADAVGIVVREDREKDGMREGDCDGDGK